MAVAAKGLIGKKLGMTQVFDDAARALPVTVIEVGPCRVAQVKTPARDGYAAVQLAFEPVKEGKLTKPREGHFAKRNLEPHRHLVELRIADATSFQVGQILKADLFGEGELIDVVGTSKGKGFAGVYKRYGFGGAPASHGTERKHRVPGSVGAGTTPSRVFKGQKLPGRMGGDRITTLNLEVVKADPENNLLLVRGAVPGPKGGLVIVRSAVRGGRKGSGGQEEQAS